MKSCGTLLQVKKEDKTKTESHDYGSIIPPFLLAPPVVTGMETT
jgi:hypothetical protein